MERESACHRHLITGVGQQEAASIRAYKAVTSQISTISALKAVDFNLIL